jgi:ATP-dependent helicase/nuclease subunit A
LPPESWYRRIAPVLHEIGRSRTDPEGRTIWSHEGFKPGTGEFPESADGAAAPEPLPPWIDAPPPGEEPDLAALKPSYAQTAQPSEAIAPPMRGGAENDMARGVHIHRLLEALPGLAPAGREAAARRYLAMPGHTLDAGAKEDILRSVLAVLSHESFRDAFAPDSLAEVSLAARVSLPGGREAPVAGRIDRLIVRGNEVLIVDYKTNRPPPATLGEIDPAYVQQLALYRLALETLYPEKTVRAAILWTEALKLMEVPGSTMDQALHGRV